MGSDCEFCTSFEEVWGNNRETDDHRLDEDESVRAPVGVVKDRPAFEAANFPGRLAAPCSNIVDESLVGAECFRVGDSCLLTDFLNCLGIHWRLHYKGR